MLNPRTCASGARRAGARRQRGAPGGRAGHAGRHAGPAAPRRACVRAFLCAREQGWPLQHSRGNAYASAVKQHYRSSPGLGTLRAHSGASAAAWDSLQLCTFAEQRTEEPSFSLQLSCGGGDGSMMRSLVVLHRLHWWVQAGWLIAWSCHSRAGTGVLKGIPIK